MYFPCEGMADSKGTTEVNQGAADCLGGVCWHSPPCVYQHRNESLDQRDKRRYSRAERVSSQNVRPGVV